MRDLGKHTSLALDESGYPHISYHDWGPYVRYLKYTYQDASGWQTEFIESGAGGKYTSLALDENECPHFSYYNITDHDLECVYQDSSGWHIETLDSGVDVGKYTSLELGENDYPHISYYDAANQDLKYAYQNASGWHKERLDSGGDVGKYTSLALDESGQVHISYYDVTNSDLKRVYPGTFGRRIEVVDSVGSVGEYTSLALDEDGYPHISYYDATTGGLKYAYIPSSECPYPLNGVSLEGPSLGETGEVLTFTASPQPGDATEPITYTWSDDGLVGGQGGDQATYNWIEAGEKTVQVTARNCGDQDFIASQPVTISEPLTCPHPLTGISLSGPDSGLPGEILTFDASPQPGDATEPITYTWSSDGLYSGQESNQATYRWTEVGEKTVQITACNCGGQDFVASHPITISEPLTCPHPLTGISLSGPDSGLPGEMLTFVASPQPGDATIPITYTWSSDGLADGQGDEQATYSWAGAGIRIVNVAARNCGGQDFEANRPITISNPCPRPIVGVTIDGPGAGYTDITYEFIVSLDPGDATTPVTYTWSSDGLVSGQGAANATYSWAAAGAHTISVAVENCGGSFGDDHTITLGEPPPTCDHPLTEVGISGPNAGVTGENITFTTDITPSDATEPVTYTWSSNGLVSGQGTDVAVYNWPSEGQYQVTASASNCGGADSDSQFVATSESEPGCSHPLDSVSIDGPAMGYRDTRYFFTVVVTPSDATPPLTYTWSPEPDIGQEMSIAAYTWATAGDKMIAVTVQNCGGMDSDIHTVAIEEIPSECLHPLTGVTLAGPSLGETGEVLTFTASPQPANASEPITYTWSSNGLVGGQDTGSANYLWEETGDYSVTVEATNCGGSGNGTRAVAIGKKYVYLPVVIRDVSAQ